MSYVLRLALYPCCIPGFLISFLFPLSMSTDLFSVDPGRYCCSLLRMRPDSQTHIVQMTLLLLLVSWEFFFKCVVKECLVDDY